MEKRLFFGIGVDAPWPESLPEGRTLSPESRHLTLAFLGTRDHSALLSALENIPSLPFEIGPSGIFDKCLFLSNVVAWHSRYFDTKISSYQKELVTFLQPFGYEFLTDFISHVTLARKPFEKEAWEQAFVPLPFLSHGLYLYESLGNLQYEPIWKKTFVKPFEEISHEADIAYLVRGKTMEELHLHAKMALAFAFPPILPYFTEKFCSTIESIVSDLNRIVFETDCAIGCAFKAVSYSGNVVQNTHFEWEMIRDV